MTKTTTQSRATWLKPSMLPFADVATDALPLSRILRLSLFQFSVGMAMVLLTGTLNRVMIVELSIPAWFVALVVSVPVVFAPLRALIGHRSDTHKSAFGWRRVPYLWIGTLLQWGGLAIMPFALLVLSGTGEGAVWIGQFAAGFAFLMVGAGVHTTQTAGLALASDLTTESNRPRIVALLFVMLLVGMFVSSLAFGWLLRDFDPIGLIRVVQGAAVLTLLLNIVALWRQEARGKPTDDATPRTEFATAWGELTANRKTPRLLIAVALGSAGFGMQDVLLEPFGGQILGMSVSQTTLLTALLVGGMLVAFAVAARCMSRGSEPHRLAAYGALVGVFAFSIVAIVSALTIVPLFSLGVFFIGFGGGLFAVGSLTAAMALTNSGNSGIALGTWGAVQATATGVAIAIGGTLRDFLTHLAESGTFGPVLSGPATGYTFVYHLEVLLLFVTLVVIGPLAKFSAQVDASSKDRFGLAEFPN